MRTSICIALAATVASGAASAATFDFAGGAAPAAQLDFGPIGGVSVTATPNAFDDATNQITGALPTAAVTQNAAGLGVRQFEDFLFFPGENPEINGPVGGGFLSTAIC